MGANAVTTGRKPAGANRSSEEVRSQKIEWTPKPRTGLIRLERRLSRGE